MSGNSDHDNCRHKLCHKNLSQKFVTENKNKKLSTQLLALPET